MRPLFHVQPPVPAKEAWLAAAAILLAAIPGVYSLFPRIEAPMDTQPADVGTRPSPDVFGTRRWAYESLKGRASVRDALEWLGRHQNRDGSWSTDSHAEDCKKDPGVKTFRDEARFQDRRSIGLTSLALLAYLGAGITDRSSPEVRAGLAFLLKSQDASGRIASDSSPKFMYEQMLATLALVEAYGLARSPELKNPAERALDYAYKGRNPGKGWRYQYRSGDNDTSVTGWGVQVLRAAELAGFKVPPEAKKGAIAWLDEVTDKNSMTGYIDCRQGRVVIPGVNENFHDHPTMTSVAVASRLVLQMDRKDAAVVGGMKPLFADMPEWDEKGLKVDFYYWYHASQAWFQFEGPRGAGWKTWSGKVQSALLDHQERDASQCSHGSWNPVDRWSSEGGRAYTTAMGVLILQTAHRYAPAR